MKYTILKNGSRISSGTVDMCADQKKDSKGIKSTVVSFGFPDECPVPKVFVFKCLFFNMLTHIDCRF